MATASPSGLVDRKPGSPFDRTAASVTLLVGDRGSLPVELGQMDGELLVVGLRTIVKDAESHSFTQH